MFAPNSPSSSRRRLLFGSLALAVWARRGPTHGVEKALVLVLAPSNLGLRPEEDGTEPGTWRAPEVLRAAGLERLVSAEAVVQLPRPPYDSRPQIGTRIRNGLSLRRFSLELGEAVRGVMQGAAFPLVIGGDCSILLGSLFGARMAGTRGLIHVDGHSDFFHPGNYDARRRLGSAAGMDLALATGRGEPLLTQWPAIVGPLVREEDAIQIGERDALREDFRRSYSDVERTAITRYTVQSVLEASVENTAQSLIARLHARGLDRVWLHVDLDVLAQSVMPAVDSPGSPGLTFAQLRSMIARLYRSGLLAGASITNYDPGRDLENRYAVPIVTTLAEAFTWS